MLLSKLNRRTKMENTIVIILVALALVVGVVGGAVFTPNDVETKIEYQDRIVEKLVNVTVEKLVEIPEQDMLSLAIDAFLQAVDDEEDEAGNDVDVLGNYNFDEVEVSKVYNEHTVFYNDDETTVDFSIRLRFKEDDSVAEKITYDVTVTFEEDEDTEVLALEK